MYNMLLLTRRLSLYVIILSVGDVILMKYNIV